MSLATPGDIQQQGIEQLRNRTADLHTAVVDSLRQHVLDNVKRLASMRLLATTGQTLVDTFLQYLTGALSEADLSHQVTELVEQGLGPRSALMAVERLTQASLAILEADPELHRALQPAIDAFRMQFALDYLQARTDDILISQESIRQGLTRTLEERLALEQRLRTDLQRHQSQLQAVVQIARAVSSILDLHELLPTAVNLIQEQFDLYYVGIFLVGEDDESREWAILRAGTGEAGREMLRRGHRLQIGGRSMIGQCITRTQVCIAQDASQETERFDNPLLPETRSEIAVPLAARGQVIGAMTVQSNRMMAFSEVDIATFEALAGQLANAIQNARLFEQTQSALRELEKARRRYVGQAWQAYAAEDTISGYLHTATQAGPTDDAWLPAMTEALQQQETVVEPDKEGSNTLALPLTLYGNIIGVLGSSGSATKSWSQEEIAVVEAIGEQMALALESRRLFDEAQRALAMLSVRVKELNCLNDIGRKIDESPPVDEFLAWVAERIPEAMQFPDLALVAIRFHGQIYGDAQAFDLPRQIVQSLHVGGERAGKVCIAYREERDFLDEESALLGDITRRIRGYLENMRLLEETRSALAEMETLYHAGERLSLTADVDEAAQVVVEEIGRRGVPLVRFILASPWKGLSPTAFKIVAAWNAQEKTGAVNPPGTQLPEQVVPFFTTLLRSKSTKHYTLQQEDLPPVIHDFLQAAKMQAVTLSSVFARGRYLGIIALARPETQPLEDRLANYIQALITQAAATIENRYLFEEARIQAEELTILNEMGQALASHLDITALSDNLYRHTSRLMPFSSFYVALYDAQRDIVSFPFFIDRGKVYRDLPSRRGEHGLTEYVIQTGQPLLLNDEEERHLEKLGFRQLGERALSWLGAPMLLGEQVLGMIAVQSYEATHLYNERHRDLIMSIASQAAIATENIRLFEEAQARAGRERLLREITARLRGLTDPNAVARTAVRELGAALGRPAFIRLDIPAQPGDESGGFDGNGATERTQ